MDKTLAEFLRVDMKKEPNGEIGFNLVAAAISKSEFLKEFWDENSGDKISELIKKSKSRKTFLIKDLEATAKMAFPEREEVDIESFVFSYLVVFEENCTKQLSQDISDFIHVLYETLLEPEEDEDKAPEDIGCFYENITQMSRDGKLPKYEQFLDTYETLMATMFSEKSHVPILVHSQDKVRNAIYGFIASEFSLFKQPLTLKSNGVYMFNAKSILSKFLAPPHVLMANFENQFDLILSQGGGTVLIDEVDCFFDTGESFLLRRVYNSCRERGLFLILGCAKTPPKDFWLETVKHESKIDQEDAINGYLKHLYKNYNFSIESPALALIKKSCAALFSNFDLDSILKLIEKSAAYATLEAFTPSDKIIDGKNELSELISIDADMSSDGSLNNLKRKFDEVVDDVSKQYDLHKDNTRIFKRHVEKTLKKYFKVNVENIFDIKDRVLNLKDNLNAEIFGQEQAVEKISQNISRAYSGLFEKTGPLGVFFALGSSGVGKTFLAKTLQKCLYGDTNLIRLDMGEYLDKTSVNKLLGTGAGYVGFEDGSPFFKAVKKNPRSIILIDEIEKSTPEVMDVFLGIFDEGFAKDNRGQSVDFSKCIFIVTGNIGSKSLGSEVKTMGFLQNTEESKVEIRLDLAREELKSHFRPEFLNRIDEIVYFNPLNDDVMRKIISKRIESLAEKIKLKGVAVKYSEDFVEDLLKKCKDPIKGGARLVEKVVRDNVESHICEEFIKGKKTIEFGLKISEKQ